MSLSGIDYAVQIEGREGTRLKDLKFIPGRKGLLTIFKTLGSLPSSLPG